MQFLRDALRRIKRINEEACTQFIFITALLILFYSLFAKTKFKLWIKIFLFYHHPYCFLKWLITDSCSGGTNNFIKLKGNSLQNERLTYLCISIALSSFSLANWMILFKDVLNLSAWSLFNCIENSFVHASFFFLLTSFATLSERIPYRAYGDAGPGTVSRLFSPKWERWP